MTAADVWGRFASLAPTRFISFVIVGATGVIVHLVALGILYKIVGLPFWMGQSVAALIGTSNNFFLNNIFTFRGHRLSGRGLLKGWLTFNLVYAAGAVCNVGVATWLFRHGVMWMMSALIGIAVTTIWNYVMSSIITWRTGGASVGS